MALRPLPPVLALASLLAVSACLNKPEPSAPPAELVSLPPMPPPAPTFEQTGKASFYGRQFHGRTTASGEKFDMNDMTAAHRTLPMGTVVKVTNLENGRSVSVTINDRGPYRRNRVIDLSQAAASEIGLDDEGIAMVKVEAIPGEQPTQTADQSGR